MQDASLQHAELAELAMNAFAEHGFAPSDAVRIAAIKNLSRLTVPSQASPAPADSASFDEMLKSCAHA